MPFEHEGKFTTINLRTKMKDIDKELSTILRKVVLFDEEDKLETELIENIKELFKESVPAETLVSKPIYIVHEACFQGDNLLTAFEDREDAEKYIKRAKKNYYISKPIHLVKAC